jgi:WD40 repeat protein
MKNSPFKFLDSFSKEDRNIFFGRDKEIEELHSRVFQSRILVVYGISGTGKSSLINCGLANKFNDSDWLPVSIRRGININQSLRDNLLKNSIEETSSKRSTDAVKLIKSLYLDHFKPIFLIFDQFEEVFIFGSKPERDEFVATIKRITDSDLQCRLIFSIREEYLAGLTEFEKVISSFLDNRIRIEKMIRQNATRAIEGPCEVNGIAVETGLSNSILEKLNPNSPEVELTFLQVYLDKIFRLASEQNEDVQILTNENAEKVGDVKDLLGTFLEEQISQLEDPDTGLIILKSFVSVKGTKHQITEQEVIDYSRTLGKDVDSSVVKDLIQKFIKLRILRDKDEHGRYELRHDSLASAIYEKITLVEKDLLEIRQFIDNSWNTYERRNIYLSAADLEYIAPYEDKLFLNEKLDTFVSQSKRIIHKARRRRQNVAIVTAAILIFVLSFFTIWAMRERKNALNQQSMAEEQKNAAVTAMTVADSARKEAILSKDLAVRNEKIAISAQEQSESARKEALLQKEIALNQKRLAEKLSIQASEQAQIATDEKQKAEQERKKAVEAESTARRLEMLATAQNLALTSLSMEKDPVQMGSLALKAYNFNTENNGSPNDPVIFEALTNAWIKIDSSRHSFFDGSGSEIWSIGNNPDIITGNLNGEMIRWNEEAVITSREDISYDSPLSFIRLNGQGSRILTQHDNSDILLWEYHSDGKLSPYKKISAGKGYIRAASFSTDGDNAAIALSDSSVIVKNLSTDKTFEFKAPSAVECLSLCGPDSIYLACDNGSVCLGTRGNKNVTQILQTSSVKPLSLCWNGGREELIIGYSDGSMLVSGLRNGAFQSPLKYIVHSAGIELMAFNNDYSLFASAGRDNTIRLYFYNEFIKNGNLAGGTVLIKDLAGRVRSISLTPDNKLAAGLSDKTLRVWETSARKLAEGIGNILEKDFRVTESTSGTTILQK